MKWILIKDLHINTDHVQSFFRLGGSLVINFAGEERPIIWKDPDKKLYTKMCHLLGVRPAEEDPNGEE